MAVDQCEGTGLLSAPGRFETGTRRTCFPRGKPATAGFKVRYGDQCSKRPRALRRDAPLVVSLPGVRSWRAKIKRFLLSVGNTLRRLAARPVIINGFRALASARSIRRSQDGNAATIRRGKRGRATFDVGSGNGRLQITLYSGGRRHPFADGARFWRSSRGRPVRGRRPYGRRAPASRGSRRSAAL